jgi:hypothetical protein
MNDPIMLGCLGFYAFLILWYLWMWTYRTQDMVAIVKAHEDAKKAQHERMSKAAGGLIKAGIGIGKILRK